ncbi:putative cyclase [Lophiostoma macrostomum CBS 122681]|uniref:Putative cyclase n=1 Tax=Lophiostoma macrostomum CBS 122681 TaxID=1314788 RepID=A0A6A6SY74_9PLEO|nr:putative cyclase [Lophiostoma macrostomum CBS 122681]
MSPKRPAFEELPFREGDPPYSAWGIWGEGDELGTLNFLIDDVVAGAARLEIRTGLRISLDWPLDKLQHPSFGRQTFHRELVAKAAKVANDDVITMNTQSSSQWDGLRHFAYQKDKKFYGGRTNADFHDDPTSTDLGIQHMATKSICGRAILIDHVSYALKRGIYKDAVSHHSIPLSELKEALADQKTEVLPGDILFIRSGFTRTFEAMTDDQHKQVAASPPCFTGVQTGEEMAKWIWDSKFSAVAGDAPSFEAWPQTQDIALHEILLAGWGCPIGELFDLEQLAEHCKNVGRWSFFLASVPLKIPGGAASPPNAVAIF